jgi:phosphoglycolate phosphatase
LFDLDGTLLDTAADIALALNRALAEFGWSSMGEQEVRRLIGRGGVVLVERAARAQQRSVNDATKAALVERFFHHYGALEEHDESTARPYPGVMDALQQLHAAGLRQAVITNKQRRFALALLERLELLRWFELVVGGDSCERRKPDPQPLQFACQSLGLPESQVLMVGDSINDVQAARAAGMPIICVTYGYNEGQDPRTLPCDAWLDSMAELPPLLLPQSPRP